MWEPKQVSGTLKVPEYGFVVLMVLEYGSGVLMILVGMLDTCLNHFHLE